MAKVLGYLIRHFSNYYILHRSDLAARAAPLDPRLRSMCFMRHENSLYAYKRTPRGLFVLFGKVKHDKIFSQLYEKQINITTYARINI